MTDHPTTEMLDRARRVCIRNWPVAGTQVFDAHVHDVALEFEVIEAKRDAHRRHVQRAEPGPSHNQVAAAFREQLRERGHTEQTIDARDGWIYENSSGYNGGWDHLPTFVTETLNSRFGAYWLCEDERSSS